MRSTLASGAAPARTGWRSRLGGTLTLAVIWVPLLINAAHVVGFTLWTTWLSFTPSDLLPEYTFAGLRSYWSVTRAPSTQIAYVNLVIYSVGFVALATLIGFVSALAVAIIVGLPLIAFASLVGGARFATSVRGFVYDRISFSQSAPNEVAVARQSPQLPASR